MSWSASAIESRPERHTLLMVIAGTLIASPPFTAAWRAVIWPAPAWSTLAHDHVVDLVGRDTGALEARP